MNPADAEARGLASDDPVRVFNDLGEVQCPVALNKDIRPGMVSLPKGLWRKSTFNGSTSNALVPDTLTDLGGGACFNDARVQVALLGQALSRCSGCSPALRPKAAVLVSFASAGLGAVRPKAVPVFVAQGFSPAPVSN